MALVGVNLFRQPPGITFGATVVLGTAARIMTGAPIPSGADAVVNCVGVLAEQGKNTFDAVQAEFDRLPVPDGVCDLAVFNGAVHYSTDPATTLAEAFRAPAKPVTFNHWVQLEVRNPEALEGWHDLLECPIETDRRTPELFGKIEAPATWGGLIGISGGIQLVDGGYVTVPTAATSASRPL